MARDLGAEGAAIRKTAEQPSSQEMTLVSLTLQSVHKTAAPHSQATFAPGQQVGRYEIGRPLGRGGMGEVFEARDRESNRRVALKLLNDVLPDETARRRFLREGRLAAQITHPHCVYVFAAEEIEGRCLMAMELMPGGTLAELVAERGVLPVEQAVEGILQLISGLSAALEKGVLHRDIKPANCMIAEDGSLKVGDFGLSLPTAALGETKLTIAGTVMGTPTYASPEQMRAESVDVRSDLYSVGATLYFMLTGRAPYEADNLMQLLTKMIQEPPPTPTSLDRRIPAGLSSVVMRCLEKKAGDRFRDYDELENALRPYARRRTEPAPVLSRLSAYLVDLLLSGLLLHVALSPVFVWLGFPSPVEVFAHSFGEGFRGEPRGEGPGGGLYHLALLVVTACYWLAFEVGWRRTPGKRLFRLFVADTRGELAPRSRVLLRTGLYLTPGVLGLMAEALGLIGDGSDVADTLIVLLLVTYPRRGAAIHDLLSGTRVVRTLGHSALGESPIDASADAPPSEGRRLGPYRCSEQATPGSAFPGYDETLKRRVWLVEGSPTAPPIPAGRCDVARIGRLRWIDGARGAAGAWDAWEAPVGTPFRKAVERRVPWSRVRRWLLDLAEEMAAATKDGTLPVLGVDRVWITGSRAKLLDFAPPGLSDTTSAVESSSDDWRSLLLQVAAMALEGSEIPPGDARPPRVPLPGPARLFLEDLAAGRSSGLTEAAEALRSLQHGSAAVGRSVPLLPVIVATPFVLMALAAGVFRLFRTSGPTASTAADVAVVTENLLFIPFMNMYLAVNLCMVAILVALPCTLLLRGGLLLGLAGASVVRPDGQPASRLRCLARSAVAWSPLLLLLAWILVGAALFGGDRGDQSDTGSSSAAADGAEAGPSAEAVVDRPEASTTRRYSVGYRIGSLLRRARPARPDLAAAALMAIFLAGLGYWIRTPGRGLQDRIAGTVLVPRK